MAQPPLPLSKALFIDLVMGFCLGVANIVPGVSGGTFLLIFGVYERVFLSLKCINAATLTWILRQGGQLLACSGKTARWREIFDYCRTCDFFFILRLVTGAALAILGLSSVMKSLLIHQFPLTYSLFFGLILVSILIPLKQFRSPHPGLIFFVVAGISITLLVTVQVNPYDKVKQKSDHYQAVYHNRYPAADPVSDLSRSAQNPGQSSLRHGGATPPRFGAAPFGEYLYAAICGAVSISAMVLPGISGSLVLILMGAYFDVLSAISRLTSLHLDAVAFLGCFGLGMVLGGLVFVRLVSYILNRYHDPAMAFLLGLMAGSLWALWPFKQVITLTRQYIEQGGEITVLYHVPVHTNINVWPPMDGTFLGAVGFFSLGCVLMYGFLRIQSTRQPVVPPGK